MADDETYRLMQSVCPASLELSFLLQDDDDERREKIADCDAIVVASTPLKSELLEASPHLRLAQHQGVGYQDTVDIQALAARGIRLALTATDEASIAVAEHTVMLALAASRHLAFADREMRAGRWRSDLRAVSSGLKDKVVGYVGMGRIARFAAKRFAGFETTGLYCNASGAPIRDDMNRAPGLQAASFDEVVRSADIITLHLPLTAGTRHLIGRHELARMKRGAVLVNTSRGAIVDEAALIDALRKGPLAAAGLDVFESEPLARDSPLRTLDNVVLTPHVSAGTREVFLHKMAKALNNIDGFFRGRPLRDEVCIDARRDMDGDQRIVSNEDQ